jgi:hypothetical protein
MSRSGLLGRKLFIILQEKNGKFGPRILEELNRDLEKYPNLVVVTSKSGMIEKPLMRIWLEECLLTEIDNQQEIVLLLDSYSNHKKKEEFVPEERLDDVRLELIPANTTSIAQPLDRYYFRQDKLIDKRIVDAARQKKAENEKKYPSPHERSFTLRRASMIHQQMSAPIFKFMLRGAWDLCGYAGK